MSAGARTAEEYIASLPEERRDATRSAPTSPMDTGRHRLRNDRRNLPLETFPDTFNGRPLGLAGLANQKNDVGLYLNRV